MALGSMTTWSSPATVPPEGVAVVRQAPVVPGFKSTQAWLEEIPDSISKHSNLMLVFSGILIRWYEEITGDVAR
jgi:hypothetical protein